MWLFKIYFKKFSSTSSLTPVFEKPPSWNKFCIVTDCVKSENKETQYLAQSSAEAFQSGDICSAYLKKPSKPFTPLPAVVIVGDCETVFTLTLFLLPKW